MRLAPLHGVRSFALALAAAMAACAHPAPEVTTAGASYDVTITNAKIIDGTGDPFYYGDIGIRADRIAAVTPRGALAEAPAVERVDANGLAVSPGFIDIQSHSWTALLFADSRVIGKVSQGVTSEILGEGATPAPSNASWIRSTPAVASGTP
jgi:N-acyl-D-aspartate/D-glutamate deacylase